MIELQTTITHTEKRTLKLNTPSFWKNPTTAYNEYRGVLDEETYVSIRHLQLNGEILQIENTHINNRGDYVLEAQEKWTIITEAEFMQVYDDAYELMRLHPKMFTIGTEKDEAVRQAITL